MRGPSRQRAAIQKHGEKKGGGHNDDRVRWALALVGGTQYEDLVGRQKQEQGHRGYEMGGVGGGIVALLEVSFVRKDQIG